ncbi:MAG TPA: hypothetical protein VNN17_11105 [Terriglobia bacterium]|nr:hypothetical protein [Terriglobia bacterium]
MQREQWKIVVLVALLLPCLWLVRRNLFPPQTPAAAGPPRSARSLQGQALDSLPRPRSKAAAQSQQQLLEMDPSLRLDLLEASRSVTYQGSSRNIFEFYTPPPPPAAPPAPIPQPVMQPAAPSPPRPPAISLKFYGVAQHPGGPRRAFLTDGEEIIIAQEGDTVARFYKVNRIGISSLELRDTRTNQTQQLPLLVD